MLCEIILTLHMQGAYESQFNFMFRMSPIFIESHYLYANILNVRQ